MINNFFTLTRNNLPKNPFLSISNTNLYLNKIVKKRGRPITDEDAASYQTKRRRLRQQSEEFSRQEVLEVIKIKLRDEDCHSGVQLMDLILNEDKADEILHAVTNPVVIKPYTPEQAISQIVDCFLSKADYLRLRADAKWQGADIYPSCQEVKLFI